jgi:hypothetical protein
MSVSVTLIDVCLGCYLTDHHNSKGELLLGVSVDNTTTLGEIKSELLSAINAADYGLPSWFSYAEFRRSVAALSESDSEIFDSSLDPPDDSIYDESCSAWFLVEYSR